MFITSNANGGIVSAELGYGGNDYGMLRARALANYEYVSAELGYGSGDYAMLRARSLDRGAWESFR